MKEAQAWAAVEAIRRERDGLRQELKVAVDNAVAAVLVGPVDIEARRAQDRAQVATSCADLLDEIELLRNLTAAMTALITHHEEAALTPREEEASPPRKRKT